jgi:plasmid stability protein
MPTLTLKNLPADVHRRLKARATRNRRSLNREAIECLRIATSAHTVDVDAVLARARLLRREVSRPVARRELEAAKRGGRP